MRRSLGLALGLTIVTLTPAFAEGSELGEARLAGSHSSMERQNEVARDNDFSFSRTSRQVHALVDEGRLVPMSGNQDYKLANVSHPAARPVTKTFVERLGRDYHASCGDRLVVTSLTRPLSEQPRNASDLSVHPAGMAVDLRVPARNSCRVWLENELLSLERRGVLDVTREHRPSHYHVAVFPRYGEYVGPLIFAEDSAARVASEAALRAKAEADAAAAKAERPAAAATAGVTPGPGLFASLLYATILMTGVIALLFAMRGPEKPKPVPAVERRRQP
jgi:hypothetical protein